MVTKPIIPTSSIDERSGEKVGGGRSNPPNVGVSLGLDPKMATMKDHLEAVQQSLDADVIALIGPMERGFEERLIELAQGRRRRTNVLLILTTYGGDPGVAYKVARCIQRAYETKGEQAKG